MTSRPYRLPSTTVSVRLVLAFVAVALLGGISPARGSLVLRANPDILLQAGSTTFDPGTDEFTFTGTAAQLLDANGVQTIDGGGGSTINATINDAGVLIGGDLTINGTIPSIGANTSPLLTGDLTALVNAEASGGLLEFTFTPTGGDPAVFDLFQDGPGGIILSQTGFSGSFTSNFSASLTAQGDVGVVVPEPSTLISGVLGLGCLALVAYRRGRRIEGEPAAV